MGYVAGVLIIALVYWMAVDCDDHLRRLMWLRWNTRVSQSIARHFGMRGMRYEREYLGKLERNRTI